MSGRRQEEAFGGAWTAEKLSILEAYLNAYTTALIKQQFSIIYIDAFAGSGQIQFASANHEGRDSHAFISGSAERAARVDGKPFDKLVFVEQNPDRCRSLEQLRDHHSNRAIEVVNREANEFLSGLQEDWRRWRGVLFLDPFATEVEWRTIERVAGFNALDVWILFPVAAIKRMLPVGRLPDASWIARLDKVFGDSSWQSLYRPTENLLGDKDHERRPGVEGLLEVYKGNLSRLFGGRFLEQSRTLKNSRNSHLYEFMFCAGSPRGAGIAKKIAEHIIEKL